VIDEVRAAEDLILFIDELHTVVGAGAAEGAMDASNMLKPALARGELHVIGATTVDEYRKNIEKDPALERGFQPVFVREPTVGETIEILHGLKDRYEAFHRVRISDNAIVAAAELSDRYIRDCFLPNKAIDLIDQAGARVRLRMKTKDDDTRSLEEDLRRLARERDQATAAEDYDRAGELKDQLESRRGELEEKRKGRSRAPEVTAEDIAEIVSRPTGIPVSQLTTEERERLMRLEEELHARIVGQEEAVAAVVEAVRRRPYAVLLFDEIEKAHPDVFNILLQILDDGRLTDAQGRTVDFKNTIVIMTSNLGADRIQQYARTGGDFEKLKEELMEVLRGSFRPEFINRIDEIIVFRALTDEQLADITRLLLDRLTRRLRAQRIEVEFTDEAVKLLAREGFDPEFGARPLRRTIQRRVENELSRMVLGGSVQPGDKVVVGVEDDDLNFEVESGAARELVEEAEQPAGAPA
jgi:ATP-dependent Clp protease ATP-binding subunit ClpC